nr:MAG TPA: hypothetical protein [Caudoviricetes sp.]
MACRFAMRRQEGKPALHPAHGRLQKAVRRTS